MQKWVLWVLLATSSGYAASFDNPADFANAIAPSNPIVIDFEGALAGTLIPSGTAFGGVTFTYTLGNLQLRISNAFDTVSGSNALGLDDSGNFYQFIAGDAFSLSFPTPIFALGLYYITTDPLLAGDITLTTSQGSATNGGTSLQTLPDGGNVYFVGFVSTAPFETAQLGASSGAAGAFLFNIDDITYAPTPEPATWSMVGIAAALLVALRRGRSL